jgi:hypothetical protein
MKQKNIIKAICILLFSAIVVHCFAFFIKRDALIVSDANSQNADLIYRAIILKNYSRLTYLILSLASLNLFVFFWYLNVNNKSYRFILALIVSLSFGVVELIIYKDYFSME